MPDLTSIKVDDDKYEFTIESSGNITVRRYGDHWTVIHEAGKAVIALIHEAVEARAALVVSEPTEVGQSRVRLDELRTRCEVKAAAATSSGDVIGWLDAADHARESLKRLPKARP